MFHMIQCVNVPLGASGSSMMSAKLFASAGTPPIRSGGLMLRLSQVYTDGIFSFCWIEGLSIVIETDGSMADVPVCGVLPPLGVQEARMSAKQRRERRRIMMV